MRIVDLASAGQAAPQQAAAILYDTIPGWPALDEALAEVRESLSPERISRVAVDESGVLGWIGALEMYAQQHVWELHPLAVRRDAQRQGIGRALVFDLEERVRDRGVHTVFVAADYLRGLRGETGMAGVDLYPESLRNPGGHQYEFYQKVGYVIVGVVPDAKGFGNIYLAKRIAS